MIELLKGRHGRHESIGVPPYRREVPSLRGEAGGDNEYSLGAGRGARETLGSLVRVFDDVDDVAKIDDLGGRAAAVGKVYGIPSPGFRAVKAKVPYVVAESAAVIEDRGVGTDDAVKEREPDRARVVGARNRGAVPVPGERGSERVGLDAAFSCDCSFGVRFAHAYSLCATR